MEHTYVALDLETTGLDTATDSIVEIGAVRFNRDTVLDTYHTLVNPRRALPRAVKALTGITDEELGSAPPIEVVAGEVEAFLDGGEIVGHNITGFDLPVLANAGISFEGTVHDTNDLASLILSGMPEYSLAGLCRDLEITNETPHRALSDAEASMGLFRHLQVKALTLPAEVLDQIAEWLRETSWPCRDFFRQIAAGAQSDTGERNDRLVIEAPVAPEPLRRRTNPPKLAAEDAVGILNSAKGRPDVFAEFEDRAEQREMTEIVSNAFSDETPVIVEAGTGTGKSLAYLIPAAAHALASGDRVVVSTATINLQEQLLRKDLPAVKSLLAERGDEL
ncbi:MAG: exonuclease domain-containing protein, partial [Dehalococcoidia bacterium]